MRFAYVLALVISSRAIWLSALAMLLAVGVELFACVQVTLHTPVVSPSPPVHPKCLVHVWMSQPVWVCPVRVASWPFVRVARRLAMAARRHWQLVLPPHLMAGGWPLLVVQGRVQVEQCRCKVAPAASAASSRFAVQTRLMSQAM